MLDPSIHILAPVHLKGPAGVVAPTPARARALLTVLALQPNCIVSQSKLGEILWEVPPKSYKANLRTLVSTLRICLQQAELDNQVNITTKRSSWGADGGYCLEAAPSEVDILAVRDAIRLIRLRSADDPEGALNCCRRLLTADFDGFGMDFSSTKWLEATKASLQQNKQTLTKLAICNLIAIGNYGEALVESLQAASGNGIDPQLSILSIASCYMTGDPIAALKEIRQLVDYFRDHGMDVPAPIQRVHMAILNNDTDSVSAESNRVLQSL